MHLVQSSDYTSIREQRGVKTCQFLCRDMGVSSICEKLRDDCTRIAKALHSTARCEETEQTTVCTRPVCLPSNTQ